MNDEQPALGTRRLAVRLQGYATASKVRKPDGKGRLYRHNEPFPEDVLSADGRRYQRRRVALPPDEGPVRGRGARFQQPLGHRLRCQGPAAHQRVRDSASVARHPGGIYHRQGGQHFNPYVYSDIQTIADHRHRSAHGGARVYQSDAFPASQHGRIFMANIHEHAVLSDVLERKGSGFTAHHGDDFVLANNAQWIGFSVEVGPDGAVYVLDWHDSDICGTDVLHKETGRIFRIVPTRSLADQWPGRYADLGRMSDAQLVALQTSPSDWHARRARVVLQTRAAKLYIAARHAAAAARALSIGRQPRLAAACDVGPARDRRLDGGCAGAGAGRSG